MYKFMTLTFLLLGWGFYEFSGGSEFEPEQVAFADAPEVEKVEESTPIVITQSVVEPIIEIKPDVAVVTTVSLEVEPAPVAELTVEPVENALELTAALEQTLESTLTFEPEQVASLVDAIDLRAVAGSRVNMRSGPGTGYGVISTLPFGTEAEVLEVDVTGWARIRIIGSGQVGWMAERLLEQL